MTIDEMVNHLEKLRRLIGGDKEIPIVRMGFGENDYIVADYAVTGNFVDQDGNTFECALVGTGGGEEFSLDGTPHYKWEPSKNKI